MARRTAYYAPVSDDASIAAAYERSLTQQTGMSREQYAASEAERRRKLEEEAAARPGVVESVARGGLQGVTFGFSDEIGGALKSAFSGKTYKEERDAIREANRRAQAENPIAYGVGDILGGLAPAAVTGGASLGANVARTVGRAALSGAAQGAISGAGYSESEGVGGILADAAKGAAIGGATGAIAGKFTKGAVDTAEARDLQSFTKEIGAGADPTFRKRFLGQSDKFAKGDPSSQAAMAKELLERDKTMVGLLKKPHATDAAAASEIVDHAKSKLDELSSKVRPIYAKLDEQAGKVPLSDVTGWMDDAIEQARKVHGKEAIADILTEVRGNFVKTELAKNPAIAKAAGGEAPDLSQIEVDHRDIRQWVTGLLEHKTRVMGAISETENFKLVNEAHKVADNFLRAHLDAVAEMTPELADEVAKLRVFNREIATYASAKQLFEHKVTKNLMRQTSTAADDRVSGLAGIIGFMSAGPVGAAKALGLRYGIPAAVEGARNLNRAATAALAKVVRAAREGNPTAQLAKEAIEIGVPSTAVAAALGTYRNTEAQ